MRFSWEPRLPCGLLAYCSANELQAYLQQELAIVEELRRRSNFLRRILYSIPKIRLIYFPDS